jgi:predicted kinase
MPTAYIFSGLPGVGKTTLAKILTKNINNTTYLRVDTLEYFLKKEYFNISLTKQGYDLAYFLAKENLELGNNVIIDCCNPIEESRQFLQNLSSIKSVKIINIEVICSDINTHKNRVELRFNKNKNKYPSWQKVLNKDYQNWDNKQIIRIDTYNTNIDNLIKELMILIKDKFKEIINEQ